MTITAARREATNTSKERHALTVRVGACERQTTAEAKRFADTDVHNAGRMIRLSECPILSTSLKGDGQLSRGDEIEMWIYEFDSDVIGSFDSFAYLCLSLPPVAFAEFWSGCAAADGVARNISIHFTSDDTDHFFRVTRVNLVEYMPPAIDYNPKGHAPGNLPGRPHPVVAELRETRRRLLSSLQGILIVVGFVLGVGILSEILGAIWRFIQH